MKRILALLTALLVLVLTAGCNNSRGANDNPVYSAQPADTVEDLS